MNPDTVRDSEMYLGVLGVTKLDRRLWEVVLFEADTAGGKWGKRQLARRYLQLLCDRTKSSGLECGGEWEP